MVYLGEREDKSAIEVNRNNVEPHDFRSGRPYRSRNTAVHEPMFYLGGKRQLSPPHPLFNSLPIRKTRKALMNSVLTLAAALILSMTLLPMGGTAGYLASARVGKRVQHR